MRKSIAEEIYEGVRKKIADGVLRPGDRVVERALREEYNASNSPVREAIRLLCAAGVVEILFNRGAVVTDYADAKRLRDVYEARFVIESYSANMLARRSDAEDLRVLQESNERLVQLSKEGSPSLTDVMAADEEFHRTLVKLTGNRELCNMFDNMYIFSKCVFNGICLSSVSMNYDPSMVGTTAEGHLAIVGAIEKKDYDSLKSMLHDHLKLNLLKSDESAG